MGYLKSRGYVYEAWKASRELSDGRELEIKWVTKTLPSTFDHEEESEEDEPAYFIDGVPVIWEELPEEVTSAFIDGLKSDGEYDPDASLGSPD